MHPFRSAPRPLRVLTFLHSLDPGGVERVAIRLVKRWREMGIDAPLVISCTDGQATNDVARDLPVDVLAPVPIGRTLRMIEQLPDVIRASQPDVLFCPGNTYTAVAVATRLALGRNCPPIVVKISNNLDRRDAPAWFRQPYRHWLRYQARFFEHVVSMEDTMVSEIRENMRLPDSAISVIPDPALSEMLLARVRAARTKKVWRGGGRRFVAAGRLVPQKNWPLMLRAFRDGANSADTLTIFGDGPLRPSLEKLAETLGIMPQIDFRGQVAEPASLFPQFDALLLSSDYEGVPAVLLEALAADLPIVATACGRSIAPLLREPLLGTVVPVRDQARFAVAIAAVRPGSQNSDASLAQARRFTIDSAAAQYVDVFYEAARRTAAIAPQPAALAA